MSSQSRGRMSLAEERANYNISEDSSEEFAKCKEIFNRFDTSGSGLVKLDDIQRIFVELGKNVTADDIFELKLNLVAYNLYTPDQIDFKGFLTLLQAYNKKISQEKTEIDDSIVHAFVFSGGNKDCTGNASVNRLTKILNEFDLPPLSLDNISLYDPRQTDAVNYFGFREIMKETYTSRAISQAPKKKKQQVTNTAPSTSPFKFLRKISTKKLISSKK